MWEGMRFPEIEFQEDIDDLCDKLTKIYRQLVRHGLIVANNPCDERSLVVDLFEKVPEGTKLREWFFTDLNKHALPTFYAWLSDLLRMRHVLARRTCGGRSGGWPV